MIDMDDLVTRLLVYAEGSRRASKQEKDMDEAMSRAGIAAIKCTELENARIKRLKTINANLYGTLVIIREMLENLPPGIDYDADEDNPSPDDMTAHIAGLIYQKIDATTAIARAAQKDGADK